MKSIAPKKPKSIWTKNLLTETRAGRVIAALFILFVIGFVFYQAFSGLFLGRAIVVGKLGNFYTYEGDNARLVGLSYLSVILMFGSYTFKGHAERFQLRTLFYALVIFFFSVFVVSLTAAVYREAF